MVACKARPALQRQDSRAIVWICSVNQLLPCRPILDEIALPGAVRFYDKKENAHPYNQQARGCLTASWTGFHCLPPFLPPISALARLNCTARGSVSKGISSMG